ncbi:MAG: glycosyltransferase family 4 protein [Candidatus Korobacteraceae bacterium]
MSARSLSVNLKPDALMRYETSPLVFQNIAPPALLAMRSRPDPLRVAFIGNHLPRQCGIATFTTDLCDAFEAAYGAAGLMVVAMNDPQSSYSYPARVQFEITQNDPSSYKAAADFLNSSNVDLVCLQHEYGIFGGKAGGHILRLLQHLKTPLVTTFHTVLREPDVDQLMVMEEIAARSDRLVVMSEHSARFLRNVFAVPPDKIDLIPHGIPDMPLVDAASYKDSLTEGKTVLLTFGLLSPNKGFESVIRALPRILSRHKKVVYMIAGATHPQVKRLEGDRYRIELQALAESVGVKEHVVFVNRFVSPQEMASLVGSADIYITPYRYEAQAVSGTLAYAMGKGKAIISTPYWYATEVLANGRGVLIPFDDSAAIVDSVTELLDNESALQTMRKCAYLYARGMVWDQISKSYMHSFVRAGASHPRPAREAFLPTIAAQNGRGRILGA